MTRSGRRLLGYGYTNAGGVATMDYDANNRPIPEHGYVGVGAGKINMRVECRSVSETYNVLDCVLAFDGTSVTSNFRSNANINLSVDNGYVKLLNGGNNPWQQFSVGGQNTGWLDPSNDYEVEFDYMVSSDAYNLFSICGANIRLNWVSADTETHAKIIVQDGVAKLYLNNGTSATTSANVGTGTDCSFGLYSLTYLKVKNFKLYPI